MATRAANPPREKRKSLKNFACEKISTDFKQISNLFPTLIKSLIFRIISKPFKLIFQTRVYLQVLSYCYSMIFLPQLLKPHHQQ